MAQNIQSTTPALPPPEPARSGPDITRIALIAGGGFFAVIVVLFLISVVLALANIQAAGDVVRLIRDLFIIFLAMEGVLIILALAVLVVQIARLINLLQTEIKPILENTQETVKTAQVTVDFVSRNLTDPIVRASGFFAGVWFLITNLFGLRRAIQRVDREGERGAS